MPWRSRSTATLRTSIAQLPRDHRLAAALEPLVSAFGMYGLGIFAALVVRVATGTALLAGLALLPFALAGGRLMQRARQTLGLRVTEVRARDRRPPLLLVRSFMDDMLELEPKLDGVLYLINPSLSPGAGASGQRGDEGVWMLQPFLSLIPVAYSQFGREKTGA